MKGRGTRNLSPMLPGIRPCERPLPIVHGALCVVQAELVAEGIRLVHEFLRGQARKIPGELR